MLGRTKRLVFIYARARSLILDRLGQKFSRRCQALRTSDFNLSKPSCADGFDFSVRLFLIRTHWRRWANARTSIKLVRISIAVKICLEFKMNTFRSLRENICQGSKTKHIKNILHKIQGRRLSAEDHEFCKQVFLFDWKLCGILCHF